MQFIIRNLKLIVKIHKIRDIVDYFLPSYFFKQSVDVNVEFNNHKLTPK